MDNHAAWRTAYWEWKSKDPHAQAYDVLWSPRSQDIVRLLDSSNPPAAVDEKRYSAYVKGYSAFVKENCCGCHATGIDPASNAAADQHTDSLALGVHCEACHGPASQWVAEHTLKTWTSRSRKYREDRGQRATRDLAVRAKVCAECHVGSLDMPGREVNHDLLAAGHPRLNFEYTVYLANLPPHWNQKSDRELAERPADESLADNPPSAGIKRSNFELEAWEAGQLVSAEQALHLLTGRARRTKLEGAPANGGAADKTAPWPEFAEYDCFACHHDLRSSEFRQRPGKTGGNWIWGNWYIAVADDWLVPAAEFREPLARLQSLLVLRSPPPRDVLAASEQLRGQVNAALANRPKVFGHERLVRFARQLASGDLPQRGWMEAAQWSLAVAACMNAYKPAHVDGLDGRLQSLQERLAFPHGPVDKAADAETAKPIEFNSPQAFDPTDPGYRQLIHEIRKDLIQLANAAIQQNPEAER